VSCRLGTSAPSRNAGSEGAADDWAKALFLWSSIAVAAAPNTRLNPSSALPTIQFSLLLINAFTPTPRGLLKLAICVYTQIDDLTQAGVLASSQFLHAGTTEKT
jgi:hypothetical protein